jgi:hypothetical protein
MSLPFEGAQRVRYLPQGCQLEDAYADDEWLRFLACAKQHYDDAKICDRKIPDRQLRRSLSRSAMLVAFEHDGMGRIALWSAEVGLFIVIAEHDGLALTAFDIDDIDRYMQNGFMTDIRWLRR